jgi:hypothetical protein
MYYTVLEFHCRRKKKNDKKKLLEQVSKIAEVEKEEKSQANEVKRTKAELAFQKMQEKMVRFLHKLFHWLTNSYPSNYAYQLCQKITLMYVATGDIVSKWNTLM